MNMPRVVAPQPSENVPTISQALRDASVDLRTAYESGDRIGYLLQFQKLKFLMKQHEDDKQLAIWDKAIKDRAQATASERVALDRAMFEAGLDAPPDIQAYNLFKEDYGEPSRDEALGFLSSGYKPSKLATIEKDLEAIEMLVEEGIISKEERADAVRSLYGIETPEDDETAKENAIRLLDAEVERGTFTEEERKAIVQNILSGSSSSGSSAERTFQSFQAAPENEIKDAATRFATGTAMSNDDRQAFYQAYAQATPEGRKLLLADGLDATDPQKQAPIRHEYYRQFKTLREDFKRLKEAGVSTNIWLQLGADLAAQHCSCMVIYGTYLVRYHGSLSI